MDNEKRILVVDDLPSARKVMIRLLTRLGYTQIKEARDGEAALDAVSNAPFDLIISDWRMPKIDGLELYRHLRELPNGSNADFLFVTSSNERDDVISALKAGVRNYLCKPFSTEALEAKIATLLGESK